MSACLICTEQIEGPLPTTYTPGDEVISYKGGHVHYECARDLWKQRVGGSVPVVVQRIVQVREDQRIEAVVKHP